MGAKGKLDIETQELVSAAGKAAQTLAASAVPVIPPPPSTVSSQLDAALTALATSSETYRENADATDSTAVIKQQAALTEALPVFPEQDQQGGQDYEHAATQFPTLVMIPGGGAGNGHGI